GSPYIAPATACRLSDAPATDTRTLSLHDALPITLAEATVRTTSECAVLEKPRPPYFFGMIMPKNFFSRMKSHTGLGRSRSSQASFQSSTMPQSSRTGPSIKACSSSESLAGGISSSLFQSGSPEKSSPSHHTVPAAIASRSVSEIGGMIFAAQLKMGLVSMSRRMERRLMASLQIGRAHV